MGGDRGRCQAPTQDAPRGPQARRLRRTAGLGALGDEPRPRRVPSPGRLRADGDCSASCCRSSSCAPTSRCRASSSTTSTAARRDVDLAASTRRRGTGARREPRRVPRLRRRRHPRARRGQESRTDLARRRPQPVPRRGRHAPSTSCARPASADRTVSRSRRRSTPRSSRATEHGGYPLFDHLHQILEGPVVWAPGIDCGVVLSQRGGDFVFDSGQDIAIGYGATTRRTSPCTWKRASPSGCSNPTPSSRSTRRRVEPAAVRDVPSSGVRFWHH